jgi:peptide/nickel transport system ATP-binding protein
MLDLRKERGLTYLFITHDLSLAWVIADRIAVMYLGRVMEIGSAEDVIKNSHHPYTRALVGVSPSPNPVDDATRAGRTILKGETPNAAAIPSGCRFHPRCPLAFERCRTEEPPLFEIGSGQRAACWLAEGGRELPMFQPAVAGPATVHGEPAPAPGSRDGDPGTAVDTPPAVPGPPAFDPST